MVLGRCTKSSDCSQNEKGFCNMKFGTSGYCLKCRNIDENCDNDLLIYSRSLKDCKMSCEGKCNMN